MRTATAKTNLKPNEFSGIRTLLHGCVGVLNGIAEMFPEYTKQAGVITGETPPNVVRRGRRPKVQAISSGRKAA